MVRLKTLLTSSPVERGLAAALCMIVLGVCAVLAVGLPSSKTFHFEDDASLNLSLERSVLLVGLQCTQLNWTANKVLIRFEQETEPRAAEGTETICSPDENRLLISLESGVTQTESLILWINPYHLAGCFFSLLVLLIVLRRPVWLENWWPETAFMTFAVAVGSIYLLFLKDLNLQFHYTALSLVIGIAGLFLTYTHRQQPARALRLGCLSITVVIWISLAYIMLQKPTLMSLHETAYISIAATASGGHGLYPALQNYPPISIMGGIGHLAWLYVLAYQILGPSIYSLRFVGLLVGALPLPAIFLLFRRWYGPVTAWIAVTLLPITLLYASTFSIRMDVFAITFVWWALLLVDIAREKNTWRWHVAAGLWIGLGLEAHIHTSVTAIAIGILYLVDYGLLVREIRRLVFPRAVLSYSIGALMGLGFYIVMNILPDPDVFFRTAGNVGRFTVVGADLNAPMLERLARSFTALDVFWVNFVKRCINLIQGLHPTELIVWVAAFASLFWRRSHRATLPTVVLSISVVVAGFFILNNDTLLYTGHIAPALLLCVPPLLTHGFKRTARFEWADVTPGLVFVLFACLVPVYITSLPIDFNPVRPVSHEDSLRFVREHVSTQCSLMGTAETFVFDLPAYTLFYAMENHKSGMSFYNYTSKPQLWQTLQPDIILTVDQTFFADDLKFWMFDMKYEEIFPLVWRKTDRPLSEGCLITT